MHNLDKAPHLLTLHLAQVLVTFPLPLLSGDFLPRTTPSNEPTRLLAPLYPDSESNPRWTQKHCSPPPLPPARRKRCSLIDGCCQPKRGAYGCKGGYAPRSLSYCNRKCCNRTYCNRKCCSRSCHTVRTHSLEVPFCFRIHHPLLCVRFPVGGWKVRVFRLPKVG